MMDTMNRMLIRGLRNVCLRGDDNWCELVTRAVRGEWPSPAASPQTLETERGLGILDKPYYFYVLRAEDVFGLVVFVLSEAEDVVWPENARGATPFDSGGWWLDKIHTRPPVDTAARQAAFRTLDVPLRNWQDAFEQYIHTQYDTVGDYLEGRPPISSHQSPGTGFTIIKGPPNKVRAWTWEVRVPHEQIAGRLTLKKTFMPKDMPHEYREWLWHSSPLEPSECIRIDEWTKSDHVKVPKQDESVVQAARDWMALEITRG